jgi:tetratricopeptide (TPR) repeat protein
MIKKLAIIFSFVLLASMTNKANAQTCSPQMQEETNRLLSLARTFENNKEWDKAAEYYEKVALSSCTELAQEGRQGLERSLNLRNNWFGQYFNQLQKTSLLVATSAIQLIGIFFIALVVAKFILWRIDRSEQWIILPLEDQTGNDRGNATAEALVTNIHDIRLLYSQKPLGLISPSEEVDLPSFSGIQNKQNFLTAVANFDSLDVSGIGLPVGSILSSIVRWLDLGRRRLYGIIQENSEMIELTIRMEIGRNGKCVNIWRASAELDKYDDESETLGTIIDEICCKILLDTIPEVWGTSSANALRFYTVGLKTLYTYYDSQSRDKQSLLEACDNFSKALQIDPTFDRATYNLALVKLNLGDSESAVELFKNILLINESDFAPEIFYNLGVAYYQRTLNWAYDQAEVAFANVVSYYNQSRQGNYDTRVLALTYCGLTCIAAQRLSQARRDPVVLKETYEEGLASCQKALELSSGNKSIIAQAYYSKGILQLNSKKHAEALDSIRKAIQLNPYHWKAYAALGQLAMDEEEYDEAIRALEKTTTLSPDYQYAHYLLGRAYTRKEDWDKAINSYAKAPRISRSHDEWGRILAEKGHYEEAIERFEHAININSKLADAYANLAWYMAEREIDDPEKKKKAKDAALRAVDLTKGKSNNWHKLAVLGHVYYYGGDYPSAREALEESRTLRPDSPQIFYYLALTAVAEKNYEKAKQDLIKLFNLKEQGVWREKAVKLMHEVDIILRK